MKRGWGKKYVTSSLVFQETERLFKPYLEERLKQELELIIKSPEIQGKLKEAVLSFVRYQKNSKT